MTATTVSVPPLPSDILLLIMHNVGLSELLSLSSTCKILHALVHEFGWSIYLRSHHHPSHSLSKARARWNPYAQIRYNVSSDKSWSKAKFIARPLSRPWVGRLQPLLAICASRLLVAAGCTIYSYRFSDHSKDGDAPGVQFEGSYTLSERSNIKRDITSIVFAPDGGLDRTIFVGFEDSVIERILLPTPPKPGGQTFMMQRSPHNSYHLHSGDLVESLSRAGNSLLSLSSNGIAVLSDINSMVLPSTIHLQARSWSTHLSLRSSTPYAVFGTASATPLAVHAISGGALSPTPSAILHLKQADLEHQRASAVYGITDTPVSWPWGGSGQVVVSGWYDGLVRIHDLRSHSRLAAGIGAGSSSGPAALIPVMSFYDPWSFEPIYSVSCGGGCSSHIAAGSARHSVVSFWDVRAPTRGWSVHAPGNDPSPVYALALESSRLFGATQSRPFVLDFGHGVGKETYPSVPPIRGDEGLKFQHDGFGYYVTKYNHGRRDSYDNEA